MKRCSTCKENKAVTEFHICRDRIDGRRNQCKACRNAISKACKARKEPKPEPVPYNPWDWIRELAQIKQAQNHSFF